MHGTGGYSWLARPAGDRGAARWRPAGSIGRARWLALVAFCVPRVRGTGGHGGGAGPRRGGALLRAPPAAGSAAGGGISYRLAAVRAGALPRSARMHVRCRASARVRRKQGIGPGTGVGGEREHICYKRPGYVLQYYEL